MRSFLLLYVWGVLGKSPTHFPHEEDVIRWAYRGQSVPVFGGRTLVLIVLEELAANLSVSHQVLVAKAQREIDLPRDTLEAEVHKSRKKLLRPLVQPVWFHLAVVEVTSRVPHLNFSEVVEAVKQLMPDPFREEYNEDSDLLRYHILVWMKLCLTRVNQWDQNACIKVHRTMPDGSIAFKYIIKRRTVTMFLSELVWEERIRIASLS